MPDQFLSNSRGASDYDGRPRCEARVLRDRMNAHSRALDWAANRPQLFITARQLVQVYNGGAMPTDPEKVYFTHPVLVTGSETEGVAGTLTTDTHTTIPVVVLGLAPSINDYLTAYAVGGRWVAERNGLSSSGFITCSPCNIPTEDLTITWTNAFTGTGLVTMTYTTGLDLWTTGCVDDWLLFRLGCNGGTIELWATFFVSGTCPTGTSNYCSNLRSSPLALTLSDHTCSPFGLTFTVAEAGCPTIYGDGNTQFVITL